MAARILDVYNDRKSRKLEGSCGTGMSHFCSKESWDYMVLTWGAPTGSRGDQALGLGHPTEQLHFQQSDLEGSLQYCF